MCGIAGILLREPGEIDPGFAQSQAHRGPDQQGVLLSDGETVSTFDHVEIGARIARLAMIHHRLSIIDLSTLGMQPMSSPDGRYHLIYNGEVYNYIELRGELEKIGASFISRSDTEVVLQALIHWGESALERFEGMFALALWDANTRTMFLARDPFGIKPLHYHQSSDRFAFSSEMKALLELGGIERTLDAEAAFEYLRHSQTDDDRSTLIRGVHQLEPGCWMRVHLDRPAEAAHGRYWSLERTPIDLSFHDAAARLRDLFIGSVRRHLRADVQVGAALSGGVDSSAIVSVVRHLEPDIDLHTFSYVADDERLSEEAWVDVVTEHTRATVHKIRVSAEEMITDLDELIETQDQPFASTSIYAQYRVFRAAKEAGIKVMLDGQGADELLGGYDNFWGARLASMIRRLRLCDASRFVRNVSGESGLRHLLALSGPFLLPRGLQPPMRRLVGREVVPGWLDRNWFADNGVTPGASDERVYSRNAYADHSIRVTTTALPHLLRYEDRNSMRFSIESRVPFLTPELATFCVSVPEQHHLTVDGTRKALFKEAMRGIVPDPILDRRDKIGFATPEHSWLDQLAPWVDSVIARTGESTSGPVDVTALTDEWKQVRSGRKRFDHHIWRCLNLFVWAARHKVAF